MEDSIEALLSNIALLRKNISDAQRDLQRMNNERQELIAVIIAKTDTIEAWHNQILKLEEGVRVLQSNV